MPPCTFVYYKSTRDDNGVVHLPPAPIACNTADKWRNRRCASPSTFFTPDPDQSTERDWLQFLWAWHTTVLDKDLSKMFNIFRASCTCAQAADGAINCSTKTQCNANNFVWDWPLVYDGKARSLSEGLVNVVSEGKTSKEVNPNNYPEYQDFFRLSNDRGVSHDLSP